MMMERTATVSGPWGLRGCIRARDVEFWLNATGEDGVRVDFLWVGACREGRLWQMMQSGKLYQFTIAIERHAGTPLLFKARVSGYSAALITDDQPSGLVAMELYAVSRQGAG